MKTRQNADMGSGGSVLNLLRGQDNTNENNEIHFYPIRLVNLKGLIISNASKDME